MSRSVTPKPKSPQSLDYQNYNRHLAFRVVELRCCFDPVLECQSGWCRAGQCRGGRCRCARRWGDRCRVVGFEVVAIEVVTVLRSVFVQVVMYFGIGIGIEDVGVGTTGVAVVGVGVM